VVRAGLTEPGSVCDGCGWVEADLEDLCPACGATPRAVPDVIDAISDSVRASGGSVQHVLIPTALDEHEVGAFLRYRLEGAIPA
jgi:hypothetical protein